MQLGGGGEEVGVIGRTHRSGLRSETGSLHRDRGRRGEAVSTAEVVLIRVPVHPLSKHVVLRQAAARPVFSDWILGAWSRRRKCLGGWVTAEFPGQGPPTAGVAEAWAVYQDSEACVVQARGSSHRGKQPSVPGPRWV